MNHKEKEKVKQRGSLRWRFVLAVAVGMAYGHAFAATGDHLDGETAQALARTQLALGGEAAFPAQEWISRIRSTLFVPASLPSLAAEVYGRFEPEPGVVAERVTYATQLGMRVPAIVYSPKARQGRRPALIVVNGHGGDKYAWYAFYAGILYARAGAVVLTYDPLGEGERNIARQSGTRAHDQRQEPAEVMGRRIGGLMMTDVIQAVSYLSSRRDVDPRRIGAMGYSLGAFVLSLACAVEQRLHACVLVGGGNLDGPGEYWDKSKPMCQGVPYQALSFLGDRAAALYQLHARRGPTLIYNGLEDTVVKMPTHGPAFFQALKRRSHGTFETGFEAGVSHRPFFVTRPVALWLERHLDFPHWTGKDIQAMPETHISAWAQAQGVQMDPQYSSEEREGGTRALGTKVPALSREDLSVFSTEQWEQEKERLVYESWVERVRSAPP
jgi:dienelactone hydrolase